MKQLPFLNHVAGDRTRAEASATTEVGRTRPAIIVPVQAIELGELEQRCRAIAATGFAEVIEWRIDPLLAHIGAAASGRKEAADREETSGREEAAAAGAADLAEAVLSSAPSATAAGLPVLVTLRSGFEGGAGPIGEDVYAEVLRTLLTKLPAAVAVDVEIDRLGASEIIVVAHENGVPVVASHHNFAGTDPVETLLAKFAEMAAAGADVAKIAMMPTSLAEVADVLRATAEADAALECPVLGIAMGELGRTSRIMGGDFGGCATFAQLGEASAPGQIDVADLSAVFDRLYG
ncbi:type I 3-dehydroquinate dehydratase [Brevibacterium sp. GP-SGM9]|uniref:type I 3-dehydroquinate dehydratase n=1 Tax=Brevibacterium sp. GP-SGM9 TaxID=3376990 RepID=UPI0039A5422A